MKNSFIPILILGLCFSTMFTRCCFSKDENIKEPNVSGQFYNSDASVLGRDVGIFLKNADVPAKDIPMIIAPHAGYVYSGGVAGYSFKAVSSKTPKTIIILAPSHYYGFDGASVWSQGGLKTPLGVAPVDEDFAKALLASDPKFIDEPRAFDKEHSLEVEIPFLQKIYKDFKIVPVVLGQMSFETCQKLADALDRLIADRQDILVVVSSDLSHYHDGEKARAMDLATLGIIKKLDAQDLYRQCRLRTKEMCGFVPVTTALILAKKRGWDAEVLKYAHSGDVTGDNSRVVGYSAVAFHTKVAPLNNEQKKFLLAVARETVEQYVRHQKTPDVKIVDQRLAIPEGAFVSIYREGQLRGCIGNIISNEPLQKTVRDVSIASAVNDPRFLAVTEKELSSLELEISVLSRPWRVKNVDDIEMGQHGVIVKHRGKGGVFLPQVATDTGWSKEKFLSELCSQKAGLPAECWKDPATVIEVFTADVFSSKDFK